MALNLPPLKYTKTMSCVYSYTLKSLALYYNLHSFFIKHLYVSCKYILVIQLKHRVYFVFNLYIF